MRQEELKRLKMKLPEIPGIHGKDEYINSAVLVLLTLIDDEYHMVFEKRSKSIRQGGEVCFPGGRFDKENDLNYKETAIRETYEELGIPDNSIEILGRLDTVIATMGQTIDVFVGDTKFEVKDMHINQYEVERVFTIPVSYFENNKAEEYSVMVKAHPSYIDEDTNQEVMLLPSEELGLPERYKKPWGNFKQKILVYRTNEGVIWGITARIIHDFIEKLQ